MTDRITVFLADDNLIVREGVRALLALEDDFEIVGAAADYDELVAGASAEGKLLFEVADDGPGFDLASSAAKGHGFVNMSDRVGAIGGTLTVDSAPGRGTRIAGAVPLDEH